jgi:hypothetical protein
MAGEDAGRSPSGAQGTAPLNSTDPAFRRLADQ